MKRDVRIAETGKTVEIRNPKDELRFKVVLKKETRDTEDLETVYVYVIEVVSYVDDPEGEVIPNGDEYETLREAEEAFRKTVEEYSLVVKASSAPLDDIEVYADKIGYERIDPDCCFNCEFCEIDERCGRRRRHLVCGNEENFRYFENLVNRDGCRSCRDGWRDGRFCPRANFCQNGSWIGFDPSWIPSELGHVGYIYDNDRSGMVPPPHPCNPSTITVSVKPKVSPDGHCTRYRRRKVEP